jgi:nucleoid DNA-binding protein
MSQEQAKRHLVTKAELIKDVLRITREEDARDLHAVDVEVVLDALGIACVERLAAGDDVTLPGIGRLKVKARAARMGRNPRTGEPMSLPPKRGVTFNAGKKLLGRIE